MQTDACWCGTRNPSSAPVPGECRQCRHWEKTTRGRFRVVRCAHFADQQVTDVQGQSALGGYPEQEVRAVVRSSTKVLAVEYDQVTSNDEADRIWAAMERNMIAGVPIGQRYEEAPPPPAPGGQGGV
jgi:hypothetical protein